MTTALIAGITMTACTAAKQPPAPSTPSPERDHQAVLAALRELDLCAVLDAGIEDTPVIPSVELRATEPFSCVADPSDEKAIDITIHEFGDRERAIYTRIDLAGAEAYVSGPDQYCYVGLPVGSGLAIEVNGLWTPASERECAPARDLGTAMVKALARPGDFSRTPMWDACSALITARDDEADYVPGGDSCAVKAGPTVRLEFSSAIGLAPDKNAVPETIGGRQARVKDPSPDSCYVSWNQAPLTTSHAVAPDYRATVTMRDCKQARPLAVAVMAVLDQPPPTDVAPQRPLFYPA